MTWEYIFFVGDPLWAKAVPELPPNEIRPQPNFIMCSMVLRLYVTGDSSYIAKWKICLISAVCVSVCVCVCVCEKERERESVCVCGVAYIQSVQDIRLVSSYIHIGCLESLCLSFSAALMWKVWFDIKSVITSVVRCTLCTFTLTINHSMRSSLPMKTIITHFKSGTQEDLLFRVNLEDIPYKAFTIAPMPDISGKSSWKIDLPLLTPDSR